MSSGKRYQCSITTESPQEVNRKDKFQSHGGPTKGAQISQNVALLPWENANRDTTPCAKGFGAGGAVIFPSLMPLRLYKAKLTSTKRGSSSSAPRLPAGSTPRHAREAPAPRPASSPRPAGGREGGGRPRSAPPQTSSRWGTLLGARRRALGRCDTAPPGFRAPRGPQRPPPRAAPSPPARPPGPRGAPPPSPSSSSLTSRAAFSPSSRRFRSIILLRSTAALSSALSVQPMVPGARACRRSLQVRRAVSEHR